MANMAKVVNGHPTDIHPHFFLLKGKEIFFIASQIIVDAKGHDFVLKILPSLPFPKGGAIPPLAKGD
jgi:hypothetical protein